MPRSDNAVFPFSTDAFQSHVDRLNMKLELEMVSLAQHKM